MHGADRKQSMHKAQIENDDSARSQHELRLDSSTFLMTPTLDLFTEAKVGNFQLSAPLLLSNALRQHRGFLPPLHNDLIPYQRPCPQNYAWRPTGPERGLLKGSCYMSCTSVCVFCRVLTLRGKKWCSFKTPQCELQWTAAHLSALQNTKQPSFIRIGRKEQNHFLCS